VPWPNTSVMALPGVTPSHAQLALRPAAGATPSVPATPAVPVARTGAPGPQRIDVYDGAAPVRPPGAVLPAASPFAGVQLGRYVDVYA
jgi:hypothetical protein